MFVSNLTTREQFNKITGWIDASMVYGSDVRTKRHVYFTIVGTMRTAGKEGNPPLNTQSSVVDNPTHRQVTVLRMAGDSRANVQPILTVWHTIFVREHNYIRDNLLALPPDAFRKRPGCSSNARDNAIFHTTRGIVTAILQSIAYREYLSALLGTNAIPPYSGHNASCDASVSNIFATAAFRFGHAQTLSASTLTGPSWRPCRCAMPTFGPRL